MRTRHARRTFGSTRAATGPYPGQQAPLTRRICDEVVPVSRPPQSAGFGMQRTRFVTAVTVAAMCAAPLPVSAQTLDSSVIAAFRWRNVGPSNFMGRLSDVQGIPGPSKTVYVTAAAGGIWKTTN